MIKFIYTLILIFFIMSCNDSKFVEYYDSGKVKKEVLLSNDTAFVEIFYESGAIKSKFKSIQNLYHDEYLEYYENGNIKIRIPYEKGKIEQDYTEYYPSGKLYCTIPHENNYGNGIATYYYENGDEKALNFWENGNLFAVKAFTSSGISNIELYPKINISPKLLTSTLDTLKMDVFIPKFIVDSLQLCTCNFNYDFYNVKVAKENLGLPNEVWNFCTSKTIKVIFEERLPKYLYGVVSCNNKGKVQLNSEVVELKLSDN